MERYTISLDEIELYAFHGLYPGEKELGAKYIVDISFNILFDSSGKIELTDTVDYKKAYDIVAHEFKTPTPLLENLCKRIATKLKNQFPQVERVSISVSKLTPPLGGIVKAAKVAYELI